MTFIRGIQWIAVVVTGWSLSLRWGLEIAAGKGPPSQWERHVVGATLLLGIAALAMSLTARRKGKGPEAPPGTLALSLAALCGLAALAVALRVRSSALDGGLSHALLGGGWLWMLLGTTVSLGATSAALLVRVQHRAKPSNAGKGSRRK